MAGSLAPNDNPNSVKFCSHREFTANPRCEFAFLDHLQPKFLIVVEFFVVLVSVFGEKEK